MAGGKIMLTSQVKTYIELRQTLGYKLRETKRELDTYSKFLESKGQFRITTVNASEWANLAPSPYARERRMRHIVQLAQYLRLEDASQEIPSRELFKHEYARPLPYIYSPEDIEMLLLEAKRIRRQPKTNPIRPEVFVTLIGLIASTGMRISEALGLQFKDIINGEVLHIRQTKFGKSRYVPLHPTAVVELNKYLAVRASIPVPDHGYLFIGMGGKKLSEKMAQWTFAEILSRTKIAKDRKRRPRIHDLRHTFATRALEQCPTDRETVAAHFVALSTYLGHVDIKSTYWYLEATPGLMKQLSIIAEEFFAKGGQS
jgi:integrase/recombinase XerD